MEIPFSVFRKNVNLWLHGLGLIVGFELWQNGGLVCAWFVLLSLSQFTDSSKKAKHQLKTKQYRCFICPQFIIKEQNPRRTDNRSKKYLVRSWSALYIGLAHPGRILSYHSRYQTKASSHFLLRWYLNLNMPCKNSFSNTIPHIPRGSWSY